MKPKETVSASKAKEYVKYVVEGANMMTGSLHPDEMDSARQYVREAQRTLNGLIDGKIQIKRKKRRKHIKQLFSPPKGVSFYPHL